MRRAHRPWTRAEMERLRALYERNDISLAEAARMLQRPLRGMQKKAAELGLRKRWHRSAAHAANPGGGPRFKHPVPRELRYEYRRLQDAYGMSADEAATALGVSGVSEMTCDKPGQ